MKAKDLKTGDLANDYVGTTLIHGSPWMVLNKQVMMSKELVITFLDRDGCLRWVRAWAWYDVK